MLIDQREPAEIATDPIVVQTLWLVSQGVPFDIAWSIPAGQAKAWSVVLATFQNGKKYDWEFNEWRDDD